MHRWWAAIFVAVFISIAIAGCGRVNLEDLTPEAVRTQLALTPTATPRPPSNSTPGGTPSGTPGSGSSHSSGDVAAGKSLYDNWCTGCHDTGRAGAPVIKGNAYDVAEWIPILRAPGDKSKHPVSYKDVEISDNNFQDIFTYIEHGQ